MLEQQEATQDLLQQRLDEILSRIVAVEELLQQILTAPQKPEPKTETPVDEGLLTYLKGLVEMELGVETDLAAMRRLFALAGNAARLERAITYAAQRSKQETLSNPMGFLYTVLKKWREQDAARR
jgi:hypothetical protein